MFSYSLPRTRITILLPDSILGNENTLLLKTQKIGALFRFFSIYRVEHVIFYDNHGDKNDLRVIEDILDYLNRAPYLRKYVKRKETLKFTAILPPVQNPSHLGLSLKSMVLKEGLILEKKIFPQQEKIHFKIDTGVNIINIAVQEKNELNSLQMNDLVMIGENSGDVFVKTEKQEFFWKPVFEFSKKSIGTLISEFKYENQINIFASAHGEPLNLLKFKRKYANLDKLHKILYFGPLKGSFKDFIQKTGIQMNKNSIFLDFIPNQGTKTVRLEEAVHSVLAILNVL